jgi:hypothetical protein
VRGRDRARHQQLSLLRVSDIDDFSRTGEGGRGLIGDGEER